MNKMKKMINLVVCAMLISFFAAGMVIAQDKPASKETTVTVTGAVEKTDAGICIKAEDGVYTVAGQDLAAMVGKKVKATGTVTEGPKGKTLSVTAVEEAK